MPQMIPKEFANIRELLISNGIKTLFQPIVAIDRKDVVGFEAFSRVRLPDKGGSDATLVDLFGTNLKPAELYEIDKACCRQTLRRFKKFLQQRKSLCVFMNLEMRVISNSCCDRHFISEVVEEVDVPAHNIVIEISAECLSDPKGLPFVEFCRGKGFQISIDKVEHSSRLLAILLESRPDYIKLQRSVWSNPADSTYNIGSLEYIVKNCANIECTPIALGVEDEDEALYLLQANMFCHQGYYYTKDENCTGSECNSVGGFLESVNRINQKFIMLQSERIRDRKEHFFNIRAQIKSLTSLFADVNADRFEPTMRQILGRYDEVLSVFIIDENGIQLTPRLARDMLKDDPKQCWAARSKGSDHSMRDYFMHILLGYENFVTPPHPSPFSESDTVLVSFRFFSGFSHWYMLCVEYPAK
ncbi:EAL domain-containing protein [Marinifilum sp. JC120]|nr:EAL domain-containing protein [Marinifilum sp. JC120]